MCHWTHRLGSGPKDSLTIGTGPQLIRTLPTDCGPVPVFTAQSHIWVSLASRLSDWGQAASLFRIPPVISVEVVSRGLKASA